MLAGLEWDSPGRIGTPGSIRPSLALCTAVDASNIQQSLFGFFSSRMAPISGFYAIYDEQSQGVKLVDDQGFEEVWIYKLTHADNTDG